MTKPGQYTRSRRTIMQAIMWIVLGGTVAVAALVRNAHTRPVELDPPQSWGAVEVRLPHEWVATRESTWLPPRQMILTAREPVDGDEAARVVTFYQQLTSGRQSPGAYLASAREVRAGKFKPFQFGRRSGVRADVGTRIETADGFTRGSALWACTILESGLAVSIKLEVAGPYGREDERLLQRLADGMTLPEVPPVAPPAGPPETVKPPPTIQPE